MDSVADEKYCLASAATRLGVTKFTLRRWMRNGRIGFFRCGRRIVFAKSDLDAFLSECRVPLRKERIG